MLSEYFHRGGNSAAPVLESLCLSRVVLILRSYVAQFDGGPRGSGAKCATGLGWVGGLAARKDHVFVGVCDGEHWFTAAKIDIVMGRLHVHPVGGIPV